MKEEKITSINSMIDTINQYGINPHAEDIAFAILHINTCDINPFGFDNVLPFNLAYMIIDADKELQEYIINNINDEDIRDEVIKHLDRITNHRMRGDI